MSPLAQSGKGMCWASNFGPFNMTGRPLAETKPGCGLFDFATALMEQTRESRRDLNGRYEDSESGLRKSR